MPERRCKLAEHSDGVVRRTKRTIEKVVETVGLTAEEHERVNGWSDKNVIEANWNMRGVFITIVIKDEHGTVVAFTGKGTPSQETGEMIQDLVEDAS